jgi:hypothetical protein
MNFYLFSHFYTKENFADLTMKMMKSYESPELIWSLFNGTSKLPVIYDLPSTNNIRSFINARKN